MYKAIEGLKQEFESSSTQTRQYIAYHRLFKAEFKKFLNGFGVTDIKYHTPNHFDINGFFTQGTQCWYFSISDLRYSKGCMLLRTAEDYKDYTGGSNNFITLKDVNMFMEQFRMVLGVM